MKSIENINHYLLPNRYKKYGLYMCFLGIPVLLTLFTIIAFQLGSGGFNTYWDEFGGYLLHIPLSLGLFWILFAVEENEDEMFLQLRLKATFHGIRFIFVAILFLPVFALVKNLITSEPLSMPDVGSNLAVVTLMLAYANGSYYLMKRKLEKDEE